MQIVIYRNNNGKQPYLDWYSGLKDIDGKRQIANTLTKIQNGNTESLKRLQGQDNLWEIRIMGKGPGYRIYCIIEGQTIIILLGAGTKKTQAQDIRKAGLEVDEYRRRIQDRNTLD